LLLEQEGAAMISAGLSTREDGGHLMVTLRGERDVVDAASVAAALAAPRRQVRRILALTGLAGVFFRPHQPGRVGTDRRTLRPGPGGGPASEPGRTSRRLGHLGSHRS
jgi:hypothetical protein